MNSIEPTIRLLLLWAFPICLVRALALFHLKEGKPTRLKGIVLQLLVFYNLITDRWISREYTYITFSKLVKCHKALKESLFVLFYGMIIKIIHLIIICALRRNKSLQALCVTQLVLSSQFFQWLCQNYFKMVPEPSIA